MNMSAMTVEDQYIYIQRTGIMKMISHHGTVRSQHFQKAPEFAYTTAYHFSSDSQLSLSGFLNIALYAQHNIFELSSNNDQSCLLSTAMMGPDTVA